VLLQVELSEDSLNVEGQDFRCSQPVIGRLQNSNQTAHNIRITVCKDSQPGSFARAGNIS